MPRLQSPLQIGIAIGAVVLIVGALGFLIWKNFSGTTEQAQNRAADTSKKKQASREDPDAPKPVDIELVESNEGTIRGSLTYPSEAIPPELEIFAENIETSDIFSTKEHISGSGYKYRKGYKLDVPAGEYYVYGTLPFMEDQRAYYNNGAVCLLEEVPFGECEDEDTKIVVDVEVGKETGDIIIADWSATCVIPGGKQPTEKFDLPTC